MKTLRKLGLGLFVLAVLALPLSQLFIGKVSADLTTNVSRWPSIDQSVLGSLPAIAPGSITATVLDRNHIEVSFPTVRPYPSAAQTLDEMFGGIYEDRDADGNWEFAHTGGGTLDWINNAGNINGAIDDAYHLGPANIPDVRSIELTFGFRIDGRVGGNDGAVFLNSSGAWEEVWRSGWSEIHNHINNESGLSLPLGTPDNFNLVGAFNPASQTIVSLETRNGRTFNFCAGDNTFRLDCAQVNDPYLTLTGTIDHLASSGSYVQLAWSTGGSVRIAGGAATLPSGVTAGGLGGGTSGPAEDSCSSVGGALGWIMCPVISVIDGALTFVDNQVQSLLEIDRDKYASDNLRQAWSIIRNIAYTILIPIMLVMVIGTALGMEMFSAYTVKKALPRMVFAVIFITFSWYITVFLVNFFNVVGAGILGIMTTPFPGAGDMTLSNLFDPTSGGGVAAAGAQWLAIGGITAGIVAAIAFQMGGALLLIILLFLASALLVIGMVLIILLARQMFIVALILLAPLAILAWIFPGNDKMWKLWWNSFTKLLMMFPLIMGIIAVGRIFATIIADVGNNSPIDPFLKLGAYVIPYIAIPYTFKFAGGVFANLAGIVNNKEKGLFDRLRNKRGEITKKSGEQFKGDFKNGNLFKGASADSRRARFNSGAEKLAHFSKGGFATGDRRRARIQSALNTANLDGAHEAMKENKELAILLGNEDYAESGRSGRGYVKRKDGTLYRDNNGQFVRRDGSERAVRAYLSDRGYSEEDVQSVMRARRGMSQDVFNIASFLSIPGTGTGFGSGAGEMDAAINETVGGNRRLAANMLAEMRGTAERAGRADLKGAGFGKRRDALEAQYAEEISVDQSLQTNAIGEQEYHDSLKNIQKVTTDTVTEAAVYSTDGRGIASMKPGQIRDKVVPKIQQQLEIAYRSGDEEAIDQQLAKVAALYDQAQYASPEVQQIISELVATETRPYVTDASGNRTQSIEKTSILKELDGARGRETFTKFRRELGSGRMTPEEVASLTAAQRQQYLEALQAAQERDAQDR